MRADFPFLESVRPRTHRDRLAIFTLLVLSAAAGVMTYVLHARSRLITSPVGMFSDVPKLAGSEEIQAVRQRPHVLFRSTAPGPSFGRVAIVRLDERKGTRHVMPLQSERVYGTTTAGLCLQASRGVFTTYQAIHFDRDFQQVHSFNLAGTPSRTRVSRSGRMAATTVFVKGDSYNAGGFSTRTSIIDLSTHETIGDLEQFTVERSGSLFRKADFNFWGVTFGPEDERFFATLSSGGVVYLVEGRISERKMWVLREGVECPSLSPDSTRIAFKARKAVSGAALWELHVLDLKTGVETRIAEDRNVDDQAEWLDSEHVLYGMPRSVAGSAACDVWVARADGTGSSSLFLADASSPCVIRP